MSTENQNQNSTTKRPTRQDEDVIQKVAAGLANRVVKWSNGEISLEDATEDLKKALKWGGTDGYEIAKRLERDAGYSPDAGLVEELDSAVFVMSKAHSDAQAEWVSKNNIRPEFKPGDKVMWVRRKCEGVIVEDNGSIYLKTGHYKLRTADSAANSSYAVPFEDVTAL